MNHTNVKLSEIFPVSMLRCGDDGKHKPFHVLHCMAQPKCGEQLRLSPGRGGRLPIDALCKFAQHKGWHADKRGYALCPTHKPGAKQPKSDMPPGQKRAAFLAIRDRNLAAHHQAELRLNTPADAKPLLPAIEIMPIRMEGRKTRSLILEVLGQNPSRFLKPAQVAKALDRQRPSINRTMINMAKDGEIRRHANGWYGLARHTQEGTTMIMTNEPGILPPPMRQADMDALLAKAVTDKRLLASHCRVLGLLLAHQSDEVWPSQSEFGDMIGVHGTTISLAIKKLAEFGYIERLPSFRVRGVGTPLTEPSPTTESIMPADQDQQTVTARAEVPRQPTRDENRRIRDFLDTNFDDDAGRWTKDWSDEKAGAHLKLPRAWVTTIRAGFYGEDVNEARAEQSAAASELEAVAAKLKEDALGIAERAEALERACRKILGGE